MQFHPSFSRAGLLALAVAAGDAQAAEWRGLLDVRAVAADAPRSFLDGGLGKTRSEDGLQLGQAVLRGDADLSDTISGTLELSADDRHNGVVDVREAWLGWSPLPTGAWKTRVKVGQFFAPSSVEIDYDGIGWTPKRTISSSAINSWIGEELRTNGVEWSGRRLGRHAGARYDVGLVAAVFNGNDPTGTLLAWRGWSISDRIAGRNEALRLADLPVYRADGDIPRQSRTIHPFRELDGRLGYYVGANFNLGARLELAALRYDNRADPLVVKNGQYAWRTRFDHLSMVLRPGGGWEVLAQAMRGDTLMGNNAVSLDFQSWYALLSHPVGPGTLAARYDRFSTSEHDALPGDPNNETGHCLALAYSLPLTDALSLITEALRISSERAARTLIGERRAQRERSVTVALRRRF
ncbi:hypothetical protein [Duganella aceris]|uniref:Porin n=1 Tax=Duganella aceris TaxID=2703883 RepID=A0ABX0FQT0_9BURK|nr:hypothetical protein [Duganella aceris]NGZ87010.1 hypothetical protein [Duganella aceris]